VAAGLSRTSQAVAVTRAGFARPHSPDGDPDAQRKLCSGMRFVILGHMLAILRARTISSGPVLVGADFRHDDLPSTLAAAGHDASMPSLFLCEGLLVYLDEHATIGLLGGAAAVAGQRSRLAASLSIHAEGLDSATVLAHSNARRRTAEAEPWLTILPVSAQVSLLARAGWLVTASVDASDLGAGAEPGRSLLVTAEPTG